MAFWAGEPYLTVCVCVFVRSRGTTISGIVFGVVFLMGAVAALFLCVCMCVKNGRDARVGVFNTSYINTVTHGYPGGSKVNTHTYTQRRWKEMI